MMRASVRAVLFAALAILTLRTLPAADEEVSVNLTGRRQNDM